MKSIENVLQNKKQWKADEVDFLLICSFVYFFYNLSGFRFESHRYKLPKWKNETTKLQFAVSFKPPTVNVLLIKSGIVRLIHSVAFLWSKTPFCTFINCYIINFSPIWTEVWKDIFACQFSVPNIISLSQDEHNCSTSLWNKLVHYDLLRQKF